MEPLFKVGDKVKTRDGRDARVICVDVAASDYQVVAVVRAGDSEYVACFTSDGRYLAGALAHNTDLMPPKQVRYVNVYHAETCGNYTSRLDADKGATSHRIACVRVEYHHGQMDD